MLTYLSATLTYLQARLGGLQTRQDGVTAVEYALMVAIVALLLVGGFYVLFGAVKSRYDVVGSCVTSDPAPSTCNP